MALVFSVSVTILIAGFLWFYVARPILEDYGFFDERETVNYSQVVMSTPQPAPIQTKPQTEQTRQTDERVSVADQWLDRLEVDRTRTAIIELLVYSGWDVSEIRSKLKGDNGMLGVEIDAARARLGIAPEPPRVLKVRDNGSAERVIPFEAEAA